MAVCQTVMKVAGKDVLYGSTYEADRQVIYADDVAPK
jgi:hypothetical protein